MATVPHVTAWAGRTKYQANGFLFNWLYNIKSTNYIVLERDDVLFDTWICIWHSDKCASWYILVIKPTRCTTNSQIYFCNKTLHVSDSSSAHHQEFFTLHIAMLYIIQVLLTACEPDQDPDPARKLSAKPVWHTIVVCTVKNSWWWAEELSETCRILFQK